ncbi:MAG: peptidoglycan synthetase [Breznakibacter sp.]|nr:peptidoglycan synthetase [Breznakibacter sp.]
MRVHFIAIGGSAMHNLAIALHEKGFQVTGSDDEIFEPSRSRLLKHGLLPKTMGWQPDLITPELDAIILGMHARKDNPELLRAQELGLKVYSYPEYLYEQTKEKTRVVIGGSHGKTTITSMIMHVLKTLEVDFDYMVGAQIEGFDTMVRLTAEAPIAIFEGDEYLSSPIDLTPKFHWYKPHIALLSGIAWDHINVFPTWDNYVEQFAIFARSIEQGGKLIYFEGDENLAAIAQSILQAQTLAYKGLPARNEDGTTIVEQAGKAYPLMVFGDHNLQNIEGAMLVCQQLGIKPEDFLTAIISFKGAAKRLQVLKKKDQSTIFLDFAHSPSKLKATTTAVKKQFPNRKLVACMELHTFSSLNKDFLPEYHKAMQEADEAIVFFNPEVVKHKKLPPFEKSDVEKAFDQNNLTVFTESAALVTNLKSHQWQNTNLLIMTSGNLSGVDLTALANELI